MKEKKRRELYPFIAAATSAARSVLFFSIPSPTLKTVKRLIRDILAQSGYGLCHNILDCLIGVLYKRLLDKAVLLVELLYLTFDDLIDNIFPACLTPRPAS